MIVVVSKRRAKSFRCIIVGVGVDMMYVKKK